MRLSLAIFLLGGIFLSGCKKHTDCCVMPYQIYYLKATVINTSDISCGIPVLNFSEDSTRIQSITKLNNLDYGVIKLPSNFNIKSKKLYVSVASLTPSEKFACNTLGINYPHLKIEDVKERE